MASEVEEDEEEELVEENQDHGDEEVAAGEDGARVTRKGLPLPVEVQMIPNGLSNDGD